MCVCACACVCACVCACACACAGWVHIHCIEKRLPSLRVGRASHVVYPSPSMPGTALSVKGSKVVSCVCGSDGDDERRRTRQEI